MILQCKNQFGYVIKQLKIDYDKKTFAVGSFRIGADKTITKKALSEKIEELKKLGFEQKRPACMQCDFEIFCAGECERTR